MNIRNEDVASLVVEVPKGHKHLRTTIRLVDGTELTLQEATVANLVRAYTTVKSHPLKSKVELAGRAVEGVKPGYAGWQLLEVDSEDV